jgi:hypothetical protein
VRRGVRSGKYEWIGSMDRAASDIVPRRQRVIMTRETAESDRAVVSVLHIYVIRF